MNESTALVDAANLRAQTFAFKPRCFRQSHSGRTAVVHWEGGNQGCLASLGVHVGSHPLAQKSCPRSSDLRTPLLAKIGRAPRGCTAPQVGVVVEYGVTAADDLCDPLDRGFVGHGPANGRVEGAQPIGVRYEDAAVRVGQASKVREIGRFKLNDRIDLLRRLLDGPSAQVTFAVVGAFRGSLAVIQVNKCIRHYAILAIPLSFLRSGTAPFVKQLGSVWAQDTFYGGESIARTDKKGGNWDRWDHDLRIREYPRVAEVVPW